MGQAPRQWRSKGCARRTRGWGRRLCGRRSVISITEKSRCAVRALSELARRSGAGPVPIVEIAEATGVQLHFLEQIFSSLRRAGVLRSQRGVKGGYSFQRGPAEVTVLDVVTSVDGSLSPPSARSADDATEAIWQEVCDGMAEVLGAVSIADVAEREGRARDAPMFHI